MNQEKAQGKNTKSTTTQPNSTNANKQKSKTKSTKSIPNPQNSTNNKRSTNEINNNPPNIDQHQ